MYKQFLNLQFSLLRYFSIYISKRIRAPQLLLLLTTLSVAKVLSPNAISYVRQQYSLNSAIKFIISRNSLSFYSFLIRSCSQVAAQLSSRPLIDRINSSCALLLVVSSILASVRSQVIVTYSSNYVSKLAVFGLVQTALY